MADREGFVAKTCGCLSYHPLERPSRSVCNGADERRAGKGSYFSFKMACIVFSRLAAV
jgi:hypothetical protein